MAKRIPNPKRRKYTSRITQEPRWANLSNEQLLELRICDLGLKIEGTPLAQHITRLYAELQAKDLRLKPNCWLSDDWFSPDGVPGIAIPFYLAHPKLKRLERKQMMEVEGGTKAWCMQILRHEAGHALDTAFRLHRRKRYREIFGRYSAEYPDFYRPIPQSKDYVVHLEPWYAQSHPSEDFAETFAVWLTPKSEWQDEYRGWKAFKKLKYVDELMTEIAGCKPKVVSRAKVDPVHRIKKTLRTHYAERLELYGFDCPETYDHDLRKLFSQTAKSRKNQAAADFLDKNRNELSRLVAQGTHEYPYNVNQVLCGMIKRCRELDLHVAGSGTDLKQNILVMLTVHTMNYLHGGHHRVAL